MRALVAIGLAAGLGLGPAAGCKGAARPVDEPTCADAGGKIAHGMIKLREDIGTAGIDPAPEVAQLCDDDAWEPEVVRCYATADAPRDLRACSDQLTSDQRVRARELQETLYRRASEVGDGTGDGPTGIVACDEYLEIAVRFATCDQIAQPIKDAIAQSVDGMRASWDQVADDPRTRDAIEMGCLAASDALRQSLINQGC